MAHKASFQSTGNQNVLTTAQHTSGDFINQNMLNPLIQYAYNSSINRQHQGKLSTPPAYSPLTGLQNGHGAPWSYHPDKTDTQATSTLYQNQPQYYSNRFYSSQYSQQSFVAKHKFLQTLLSQDIQQVTPVNRLRNQSPQFAPVPALVHSSALSSTHGSHQQMLQVPQGCSQQNQHIPSLQNQQRIPAPPAYSSTHTQRLLHQQLPAYSSSPAQRLLHLPTPLTSHQQYITANNPDADLTQFLQRNPPSGSQDATRSNVGAMGHMYHNSDQTRNRMEASSVHQSKSIYYACPSFSQLFTTESVNLLNHSRYSQSNNISHGSQGFQKADQVPPLNISCSPQELGNPHTSLSQAPGQPHYLSNSNVLPSRSTLLTAKDFLSHQNVHSRLRNPYSAPSQNREVENALCSGNVKTINANSVISHQTNFESSSEIQYSPFSLTPLSESNIQGNVGSGARSVTDIKSSRIRKETMSVAQTNTSENIKSLQWYKYPETSLASSFQSDIEAMQADATNYAATIDKSQSASMSQTPKSTVPDGPPVHKPTESQTGLNQTTSANKIHTNMNTLREEDEPRSSTFMSEGQCISMNTREEELEAKQIKQEPAESLSRSKHIESTKEENDFDIESLSVTENTCTNYAVSIMSAAKSNPQVKNFSTNVQSSFSDTSTLTDQLAECSHPQPQVDDGSARHQSPDLEVNKSITRSSCYSTDASSVIVLPVGGTIHYFNTSANVAVLTQTCNVTPESVAKAVAGSQKVNDVALAGEKIIAADIVTGLQAPFLNSSTSAVSTNVISSNINTSSSANQLTATVYDIGNQSQVNVTAISQSSETHVKNSVTHRIHFSSYSSGVPATACNVSVLDTDKVLQCSSALVNANLNTYTSSALPQPVAKTITDSKFMNNGIPPDQKPEDKNATPGMPTRVVKRRQTSPNMPNGKLTENGHDTHRSAVQRQSTVRRSLDTQKLPLGQSILHNQGQVQGGEQQSLGTPNLSGLRSAKTEIRNDQKQTGPCEKKVLSAREKVFNMWKAGHVVGKRQDGSKGQRCSSAAVSRIAKYIDNSHGIKTKTSPGATLKEKRAGKNKFPDSLAPGATSHNRTRQKVDPGVPELITIEKSNKPEKPPSVEKIPASSSPSATSRNRTKQKVDSSATELITFKKSNRVNKPTSEEKILDRLTLSATSHNTTKQKVDSSVPELITVEKSNRANKPTSKEKIPHRFAPSAISHNTTKQKVDSSVPELITIEKSNRANKPTSEEKIPDRFAHSATSHIRTKKIDPSAPELTTIEKSNRANKPTSEEKIPDRFAHSTTSHIRTKKIDPSAPELTTVEKSNRANKPTSEEKIPDRFAHSTTSHIRTKKIDSSAPELTTIEKSNRANKPTSVETIPDKSALSAHSRNRTRQKVNPVAPELIAVDKSDRPKTQISTICYVILHGHKLICLKFNSEALILLCQFQFECFLDRGLGSVNNCMDRVLRIKKKPLDHPEKEKIVLFMQKNGYTLDDSVHTISLNDAKKIYHHMFEITNCTNASCVVAVQNSMPDLDVVDSVFNRATFTSERLVSLFRIKKEDTSSGDENPEKLHPNIGHKKISNAYLDIEHWPSGLEGDSAELVNSELCASLTSPQVNPDSPGSDHTVTYGKSIDSDDPDDLTPLEALEDPHVICWSPGATKVGGLCSTLCGQLRSYKHDSENFLVVDDLCSMLGANKFYDGVKEDNITLYSCCHEIADFLSTLSSDFPPLQSQHHSLVKEADIMHDRDNYVLVDCDSEQVRSLDLKRPLCNQEVLNNDSSSPKQIRLDNKAQLTESCMLIKVKQAPSVGNMQRVLIDRSTVQQKDTYNSDFRLIGVDRKCDSNLDREVTGKEGTCLKVPVAHSEGSAGENIMSSVVTKSASGTSDYYQTLCSTFSSSANGSTLSEVYADKSYLPAQSSECELFIIKPVPRDIIKTVDADSGDNDNDTLLGQDDIVPIRPDVLSSPESYISAASIGEPSPPILVDVNNLAPFSSLSSNKKQGQERWNSHIPCVSVSASCKDFEALSNGMPTNFPCASLQCRSPQQLVEYASDCKRSEQDKTRHNRDHLEIPSVKGDSNFIIKTPSKGTMSECCFEEFVLICPEPGVSFIGCESNSLKSAQKLSKLVETKQCFSDSGLNKISYANGVSARDEKSLSSQTKIKTVVNGVCGLDNDIVLHVNQGEALICIDDVCDTSGTVELAADVNRNYRGDFVTSDEYRVEVIAKSKKKNPGGKSAEASGPVKLTSECNETQQRTESPLSLPILNQSVGANPAAFLPPYPQSMGKEGSIDDIDVMISGSTDMLVPSTSQRKAYLRLWQQHKALLGEVNGLRKHLALVEAAKEKADQTLRYHEGVIIDITSSFKNGDEESPG